MATSGRPLLTLLVAVAMTFVPVTGLASHNSVGAHVNIVQADEVVLSGPNDGALAPDVPEDLLPVSHTNLPVPRQAPRDQSGLRYDPDDGCKAWADYAPDHAAYELGLESGEACYVGFFDAQFEYVQITQIFGTRASHDRTYQLNPAPDDGYCHGEEPDPVTGQPTVDQLLTSVDRSLNDGRCTGSSHTQFLPGFLMVDPKLVEPSTQAVTGTEDASGSLTLPLMLSPYVYLFGQPHPSNPNPSPFAAGQGPFEGAGPGAPVAGLEGACGERTHACRLLTPGDILRYDSYADELAEDGDTIAKLGNLARVCQFTPTLFYEHPKPERRSASPCGPNGRVVDKFYGNLTHGGFGLDTLTSGAPTWVSTVPGWYRGVVFQTLGEPGYAAESLDEYSSDPTPASVENEPNLRDYEPPLTDDTDGRFDGPIAQVYAVNPRVPLPEDPLWCVQPNLLATGDRSVLGVADPGVYGTYEADAIDTDVYQPRLESAYKTVLAQSHTPLRGAIATVEALLPTQGDGQAQDIPAVPDDVERQLRDAANRADPTTTYGPDTPDTPRTFSTAREAGLTCDATGRLSVLEEDQVLDGALRLDARLVANTANDDQIEHFPQPPGLLLKDPTDDGQIAPRSSESEPSPWSPDLHSFGGRVQAVLDTNLNGQFDPCKNTGETSAVDACVFQGLWDAYNPSCSDLQNVPCRTLLERLGYDTGSGVGLYFVLELTGPVLVVDEDRNSRSSVETRSHLVGEQRVLARNCIVGTSTGLAPKLADLHGTELDELTDALCPASANGEHILIEDAFDDQTPIDKQLTNADERGFFSAAIQWTRPAALPDLAKQVTGLGSDDRLCLHAIFNVQDGEIAGDTQGNLDLAGQNTFTDCDAFGP